MPTVRRAGARLAINLMMLIVWGFAGIGKVLAGQPDWFEGKFGGTFLARFPGLGATFWLLVVGELLAFGLALVALLRGEFLPGRQPRFLTLNLVWSLFVFVQLGFGQWLTAEFQGAFQQFLYFSGTLVALHWVGQTEEPRS